jgi:tetratricopeptide (TPR) repeat protein
MRPALLVPSLLLVAATAALVTVGARRAAGAPEPVVDEQLMRDADIAFFTERSRRDPRSAADLAQVAALCLQRGRETGDPADFHRAEAAARRSLGARDWRNAKAQLVLASSLLAQHRFREARREAERLVENDPRPSSRALLGEIQLELGDYGAADVTFRSLKSEESNLAVAPRLARWAEIEGRVDEAHAILVRARDAALRRRDLPREQVAWFHLRVADLALRHGRLDEARREALAGLETRPGDPRLVSVLVRWHATRRQWRDALTWAGRVSPVLLDLQTLALVGDALAALGDTAAARRTWDEVERRAHAGPEPFNRQWTQFRLDHGIAPAETRGILEQEILERPDELGWRMLAQAREATGDAAGAAAARAQAERVVRRLAASGR